MGGGGVDTPLRTMSHSLLFISLMQSVNGAQFLNIFCLLFWAVCVPVFVIIIVPLANIYASL